MFSYEASDNKYFKVCGGGVMSWQGPVLLSHSLKTVVANEHTDGPACVPLNLYLQLSAQGCFCQPYQLVIIKSILHSSLQFKFLKHWK